MLRLCTWGEPPPARSNGGSWGRLPLFPPDSILVLLYIFHLAGWGLTIFLFLLETKDRNTNNEPQEIEGLLSLVCGQMLKSIGRHIISFFKATSIVITSIH